MPGMTDSDRRAHFRSMLASCVEDARLGGLALRLELADGTLRHGRPTRVDEDVEVELDGRPIGMEHVIAYTVLGPDHPSARSRRMRLVPG